MRVVWVCLLLCGCSGDDAGSPSPSEAPPSEAPPSEAPPPEEDLSFLLDGPVLEAPEALEEPSADDWPDDPRRLVTGRSHACAIVDARVVCWGRNDQLGALDAGTNARFVPGVVDAVALAAGDAHTCALTTDGHVHCWGGEVRAPALVPSLSGVVEIGAGSVHTCARQTSGAVACWGDGRGGQFGQLGDRLASVSEPILVPGVDSAISLSAGGRSTCVVTRDGKVSCWGRLSSSVAVADVAGISDAVRVEVSRFPVQRGTGGCDEDGCWSGEVSIASACAVSRTGAVACWASEDGRRRASIVPDVTHPARLFLAGRARCSSDADQRVRCWRGSTSVSRADDVALSIGFGCARVGDEISCWGRNDHGQAGASGDGSDLRRLPVTGVQAFAAHGGVCFVAGRAREGQCVGTGFGLTPDSPVLRRVEDLDGALGIASTSNRLCWITSDRTVRCLGNRGRDAEDRWTVEGIQNVVELALSEGHGCARVRDGGVWCWGRREALGQEGHGLAEPTLVAEGATQIAIGGRGGCAVTRGRGLTCWGYPDRPGVAELRRVAQVAVGNVHACIRDVSGGVQCWGYNQQGQLARTLDDHAERDFTPTPPDGIGRTTHIQALNERTCALVDRQAWCWGSYQETDRALHREERLDGDDPFVINVGGGCALRRGELYCFGLPDDLADVLAPQRVDLPE